MNQKNILLIISLNQSPACTEEELAQFVSNDLEALITVLCVTDKVKLTLSLSAEVCHWLALHRKGVLKEIVALEKRKQISIAGQFFFSPPLNMLQIEDLQRHIEVEQRFWRANEISQLPAFGTQGEWQKGLGELFLRFSHRLIILPAQSFNTGRTSEEYSSALSRISPCVTSDGLMILPSSILPQDSKALAAKLLSKDSFPLLVYEEQIGTSRLPVEQPQSRSSKERFSRLIGVLAQAHTENVNTLTAEEVVGLSATLPNIDKTADELLAPFTGAVNEPSDNPIYWRLRELKKEMAPLPALISDSLHYHANMEHLTSASELYLKSQNRAFLSHTLTASKNSERLLQAAYRAIISSQVEIDAIRNPDADPSIGWVEVNQRDCDRDTKREVVIDTQLARFYFKPSRAGALLEFDYKPRKANLCNANESYPSRGSFTDALLEIPPGALTIESLEHVRTILADNRKQSAQCTITRQAPDIAALRFKRHLTDRTWEATAIRDFTFKAGIGAHLNNATTGFSLEHWLEADIPPSEKEYYVLEINFMLPSAASELVSVRPLGSVGGVSQTALQPTEPVFLDYHSIQGGLHGMRLIDGATGLVIDCRSAKQLDAVTVSPAFSQSDNESRTYHGTNVLFFISAKRIFGDNHTNTVFVSIL